MEDKISVIVPVYKVEKYLSQCVDSIITQTYQNLEIILVDDGSPDHCPDICDEYAKKDGRIKVIHKENGGLSSARNAGIDIATGDYIAFVDSDDFLSPTIYKSLYDAIIASHKDIAICGINRVDEDSHFKGIYWRRESLNLSQEEIIQQLFRKDNVGIVVAWNKLYKRSMFDGIRYPVGLIHEDEYVIYDILKKASGGAVIVPEALISYRIRSDSIMTQKPSPHVADAIQAISRRIKLVGETSPYFQEAQYQLLNAYYYICLKTRFNKEIYKEFFQKYKEEYKKQKKYLSFKRRLKHFMYIHFGISR